MSIKQHLKARDKAFAETDIGWTRKMLPNASDRVVEMGFHKARYNTTSVADELRLASRDWLEARGCGPKLGGEFPTSRDLPR